MNDEWANQEEKRIQDLHDKLQKCGAYDLMNEFEKFLQTDKQREQFREMVDSHMQDSIPNATEYIFANIVTEFNQTRMTVLHKEESAPRRHKPETIPFFYPKQKSTQIQLDLAREAEKKGSGTDITLATIDNALMVTIPIDNTEYGKLKSWFYAVCLEALRMAEIGY